MFDNIKVSTRLLKIPISVTGGLYAIIGFFALVSLLKKSPEPHHLFSAFSTIAVLGLLAFVHFKAFYAVKAMDKVLIRSSSWSTLPNVLSSIFIVLFVFVFLFVVINFVAIIAFLIGALIYLFLIVATFGTIFDREWFGFKYFTHYVIDFWHIEHKALGYIVPNGHDQTIVILLMVSLVLFIIPSLISIFVLAFKHLMHEDTQLEF